jgi:hypothetical protein
MVRDSRYTFLSRCVHPNDTQRHAIPGGGADRGASASWDDEAVQEGTQEAASVRHERRGEAVHHTGWRLCDSPFGSVSSEG